MMKNYPLYPNTLQPTLRELVSFCARQYGDRPAFQYTERKDDVTVSFAQFKSQIDKLGTYLYDLGYRDCHIAVFGENSYAWILSHFAVTCGRNVVVPIDKDLDADHVAELLMHSECKAMFYSNTYSDVIDKLKEMQVGVAFLNMKDISDMLDQGNQLIQAGNRTYMNVEVRGEDLASIVYTSGTTGKSKGVMLTHMNFSSCAHGACCNILNTGPVLLILPLHHTFGLVASVFSVMYYGNVVYINKSLKRLSCDFQRCKPQLMFVVPMVLETLYKTIWNAAKKQKKEKALRALIKTSDILLICRIDLRKMLFRQVLASFGGNLDMIVCGGAPMDEKYVKGFRSLGITVLNGYGITECGPVVAVNRNRFVVAGSVGVPLCCNEVKISDEGEILVRGSNVMTGYYRNEEENDRAFTDGWFRTGDLGRLDNAGALHITGRIKNLIILGNGENIAAESIEQQVYTIPYVKEVVAYGQDDVIVAEMYLDKEVSDAKERIGQDVQALNKNLPSVRNIGRIVIRDKEFPKTTTRKIKREYGEK